MKKATTEELRKQETQTNDSINELRQRVKEISETINNAQYENKKIAVKNEMYSNENKKQCSDSWYQRKKWQCVGNKGRNGKASDRFLSKCVVNR